MTLREIFEAFERLGCRLLRHHDHPEPVDIAPMLDERSKVRGLEWRTSVVDLLEALGLDSSFEHRRELAAEFGRTDYDGNYADNTWLHQKIMDEVRTHGGRVPDELR